MELRAGYKRTEVGAIPEDWEIKPLAEVFQFLPTGSNPRNDLNFSDEVRYIHYGDIHTKWRYFLDCERENIPRISAAKVQNLPPLQDGDIVMADASEDYDALALAVEIKNVKHLRIVSGLHTIVLRADKQMLSDGFKGYIFANKPIHDALVKVSTGTSVNSIVKSAIKNVPIVFPPTEREQLAIAAALSDTDALIRSLDELIEKKQNIKQGAMQELLTGKRRLAGFSGEWESKTVGDLTERFVNGSTPSTRQPEFWRGNIPWITGADIIGQKVAVVRRFITGDAVKHSSTNVIEKGNMLIVTRTGVGKLTVAPFDVAISQDFTGVYLKQESVIAEYLFRYLDFCSEKLKALNQGTSIKGVTRDQLSSFVVATPTIAEQCAIAEVLSDMDAEIERLQERRDKLAEIKIGMMQELLTGKTRLV